MSKTVKAIARWALTDNTGSSSKCMAAVALRVKPRVSWPHDPSDFNRCLKLVAASPGVRRAFPRIRKLCKQWRVTIDHWDELKAMFVAEVGWDWSKGDRARLTYERMKKLGL